MLDSYFLQYTGEAVVPFGFGLSYTSFVYTIAVAPSGRLSLTPVQEMLRVTHDAGRTFPSMLLLGVGAQLGCSMIASAIFFRMHTLKCTSIKLECFVAAPPLAQYLVNVTNTGTVDADDAVLGFMQPPGAGQDGVPLQILFGFERVHVKAGQTVTVSLYPSLSDFTQADVDGIRVVLPGEYTFKFGVAETAAHGGGYVTHTVVAE